MTKAVDVPVVRRRFAWLTLLLILLVWFFGPIGPWSRWSAYRNTAAMSRAAGNEPCVLCGAPGTAVEVDGRRESSRSRFAIACADHKEAVADRGTIGGSIGTLAFLSLLPLLGIVAGFGATLHRPRYDDGGFGLFFLAMFAFTAFLALVPGTALLPSSSTTTAVALADEPLPLLERLLTPAECALAMLVVASGVAYLMVIFSIQHIVVPWTWRAAPLNAALIFAAIILIAATSFVAIYALSAALHLLLGFFESLSETMADEIRRERGPGLSRTGPYALLWIVLGLGTLAAVIFALYLVAYLVPLALCEGVRDRLAGARGAPEDAVGGAGAG